MKTRKKISANQSSIYLCAPVNALVEGIYEENILISEIKKHGDFGLGTFDQLDGEMIMLDGKVYQIFGDGRTALVDDDAETPFVCVTFYEAHSSEFLERDMTYPEFLDWVSSLLPSRNIFYAIRIEGTFKTLKVRSVPKQEAYKPLVEVAAHQPVFDFHDVTGTLVGFFTPEFMSSINVPGLHLHFLSSDLQHGGHLLACEPQKIQVGIQFIPRMELSLPITLDYLTWDFSRDIGEDLHKAEN